MIRIFLIFGVILVLVAGVSWLSGNPGSVDIRFQGYVVTTSFAGLAGFVALLMMLTGLIVWAWGVLMREMPIVGKNHQIKRHTKGLDLLNKSLVALSAGDHRLADRLVHQAELLLPPQPMVHLIAAEAALKKGAHDQARDRFRALEASDDGKLIGMRGLVAEARRIGRAEEALRLARKAFEGHRKSPWVLKTLFSLEVEAGHWSEACDALDRVSKEGLISKEQFGRHKGALLFAEAVEQALAGQLNDARKSYEQALKVRPNFAPAVAALARLDIRQGSKRKARGRILAAWEKAPRPILARVYKELDVAESGEDWFGRATTLADKNPHHRESDLVLADAALDARNAKAAEEPIGRLVASGADRAVWQLKLRQATLLGQSTDSIEDALETATDLPNWHCTDCNAPQRDWMPLCPSCRGFDTFRRGRTEYRSTARTSDPMLMLTGSDGDAADKAIPVGEDA